MLEGVNFLEFQQKFNEDLRLRFKGQIKKLVELELIIIDNHAVRLSEKGLLFGNEVFAEFIHSKD